jgi:hypothetical protein
MRSVLALFREKVSFFKASQMLSPKSSLLELDIRSYTTLHASLYGVPEDSVRRLATQRPSRVLVGILRHYTTSRSSCAMERVSRCFLWPPPISGHHVSQAFRVPRPTIGKPHSLWVHLGVEQPHTVQWAPCWYWWEEGRAIPQWAHHTATRSSNPLPNLSYNELASAAIYQEGTMMACEAAEEKKRKQTMPRSSGGSSSGAPLRYRMIYTPLVGQPHWPPPQFWGNRQQYSSRSNNSTTIPL